MSNDPIRHELHADIHATTLGEGGVLCGYHARPPVIAPSDSVLLECIRVVDHPQLGTLPEGWIIDAARCSDCSVATIETPTTGYEEALVRVPLSDLNGVVSVATPAVDDISVLGVSPASEGCHPLVVDQQLLDASEPGDVGISRWTRVQGMLDAEPPEPLREHIERLIEQSPESPKISNS